MTPIPRSLREESAGADQRGRDRGVHLNTQVAGVGEGEGETMEGEVKTGEYMA